MTTSHRLRDLAAIVESSNDAIVGGRIDGTITSWNPAAERLFGFTADEAIGQSAELLEWAERPGEVRELLERLQAGEQITHYETTRRHRDGSSIEVVISLFPVRDDGDEITHIAMVVHDVTERRRLEEELRQAQKMEAIGRLAGGIAHDFNNLLVVIRGYSELLLKRTDGDERDYVRQIDAAAARASDFTRRLLTFSRQQALHREATDVNAVVSETVGLLRRMLGGSIDVETRLHPATGSILVDRGELAKAVLNLAINARDAMPNGGRLCITTSKSGCWVTLVVADSGVGMDEETRTRAFDPFFTTKDNGTGLGLAGVYAVAKQNGGGVSLESEPGAGTRFTLRFPEAAASAPSSDAEDERIGEATGGSEVVLLVEDADSVRELILLSLEANGYEVLPAASPVRALEVAESYLGEIDLLLTDIALPKMNGGELARRLAQERQGLRVLYTSGYPRETALSMLVAADDEAFLQKPFNQQELLRAVREALQGPTIAAESG